MVIEVVVQAPGVYPITMIGRNFDRSDLELMKPNVERTVTLTLTVQ